MIPAQGYPGYPRHVWHPTAGMRAIRGPVMTRIIITPTVACAYRSLSLGRVWGPGIIITPAGSPHSPINFSVTLKPHAVIGETSFLNYQKRYCCSTTYCLRLYPHPIVGSCPALSNAQGIRQGALKLTVPFSWAVIFLSNIPSRVLAKWCIRGWQAELL